MPKTDKFPGRTMVCLTKITNKVSKFWVSERDWEEVVGLVEKFCATMHAATAAIPEPDPEIAH